MNILSRAVIAGALSSLVVLTGCATPLRKSSQAEIHHNETTVAQALTETVADDTYYVVDEEPWILGSPMRLDTEHQEPRALDEAFFYEQGKGSSGTLQAAASALSRLSGIGVHVSADAVERARDVLTARAEALDGADGLGAQAPGPTAGFVMLGGTRPLREHLNQLTFLTGTSWRWTGRDVLVFYRDTRTFTLAVLPTGINTTGTITNASELSGQSAGGGGGGGGEGGGQQNFGGQTSNNQQTTTVSYEFDFFKDTEVAVKAMLGEGSTVAVSPSTSTVTVRGTAPELDAVSAYLNSVNDQLSRQAMIELTIVSVERTEADGYAINWNLMRDALSGNVSLDLTGLSNRPDNSSAMVATVTNPTSRFSGSQLILDALARQGNTTVKRRSMVMAMHNQPARVQNIIQDFLFMGTSTTQVQNAGVTTSTITAPRSTGLSLTLTPQILDDQTLRLEVQGGLSTPLQTKAKTTQGDEIELPTTSYDDFFQRARMHSGSTLILTGMDYTQVADSENGIGSPKFHLFGGGRNTERTSRQLVILLTPYIDRS